MSRWIAGFCVAVLFGVAIAVVQVQTSAGLSWLTILWAAWIVAVLWALTRSSFSLLFAAIMAAMFLFVILPATQAQLFGHTTIAGNDYQAGVVRALEIAALAQCGMLVGAMAVRTSWPVPGFRRLFLRLSSSRLDRAAWQSVFVAILAVIAFSVLGGASLRSFLVYTTPGGYGTFAGAATGDLRYLAAVQCVAGLALVLLPLRLCCSGSSRRLGPLFFAPFFRKIQSENGIGSLRYWFTASLVIQVPVAIVAARRWSTVGAAVAALACSAVFEAAPVARKLSALPPVGGNGGHACAQASRRCHLCGMLRRAAGLGTPPDGHCDHRLQCYRRHHGRTSRPSSASAISGGRSSR